MRIRYKQYTFGWRRYVIKGILHLRSKHFFVHISPRIAVGSLSNTHIILPAHGLQAVQVRLKSVSKEGHLTLETEIVFRPCLPYDYSEVTE
jgi:hypothetical protein